MPVLSITGGSVSRSSVYTKPKKPRNKQRKQNKPRRPQVQKPSYVINEQQAKIIIDKQLQKD